MKNLTFYPQSEKNMFGALSEKNNFGNFRFRSSEFNKKFRNLQKHFISIHLNTFEKQCTFFFSYRKKVFEIPFSITDNNIMELFVLENYNRHGSDCVFKDEVVYTILLKYYNVFLNYYGNKH